MGSPGALKDPRPEVQKASDDARGLLALFDRLRKATTQEEKNDIIREIEEFIKAGKDSKEAALAMAGFLRQGIDADTGLDFLLSEEGGGLETAPSFRLMLLDNIMESDREIGLQVSREVMDQLTNADEYAISLKNLVAYDRDQAFRKESEGRFETLMNQSQWLENPSAGVLESFDFATQFSSRNAFGIIATVLKEHDEAKYANAFGLAADRMMLRNQGEIVKTYLEAPDDFLQYEGESEAYTRSVLLSRMDITRPEGLDAFTRYLNSFATPNEELTNFIGFFPNAIYFAGPRLVTSEEHGAVRSILDKDEEVLAIVQNLVKENKVPREYGEQIIKNLERHTTSEDAPSEDGN